jgi:uncharacterized protein (DUF2141 family)
VIPALKQAAAAVAVCGVLSGAGGAAAADLVVAVTGLKPLKGNVHVALYDTPESFPNDSDMLADQIKPVDAKTVTFTFADLKPGRYALATFHDENLSGGFDTGLFNFPLEGFAFSNGAKPGLSAPGFDEAAIDVPADGAETSIEMDYWIGSGSGSPDDL